MDAGGKYSTTNAGYDQYERPAHPQVNMQPPPGQQYAVNMAGTNSFTVVTEAPVWSWCNLITSVISVLCCVYFWLCSIPALVLSILAYVDHKVNHFEASRQKRQVACGLAVTAIVLGSLAAIGLIIMAIVMASAASDYYDDIRDNVKDNYYNNGK